MQRAESEPESAAPPSHKRPSRPRPRKLLVGAAAAIALVTIPIAAIAAWQVDESNHSGRVARATSVAGITVSGDDATGLHTKLLSLQQQLRSTSIAIGHDKQTFTTQTNAFELDLDIDATQTAVMKFGHDASGLRRFGRWVKSHFGNADAPTIVRFDEDKLSALISDRDPGPRTPPTNPGIAFENGDFVTVEGKKGTGLVNHDAADAVRAAVRKGLPLRAHLATGDITPLVNTGGIDALVQEAKTATQQPLHVSVGGKQATLTVQQLQPLVTSGTFGDRLRLDINSQAAAKTLEEIFPDAGTKPVPAGYDIIDDKPVQIDGKPGTECCGNDAAATIRDALTARLNGGDANAVVALPMKTVETTTTADLPDLGIKEKIATFTTYHPKNQPRVTNIHLISDLTRGTVLKPGETFSINNAVGKRTTEKGFVVDHVIEDGKFTESVGGGISQYATTVFNAAFFGGLDFGEYQSHSIYIDRYPYGREATVSFPHPDMQVKNTTPYGVLLWPTYTDNSLTVSLYSTKYATGEQTGQTTAPSGKCTRVRTERTRTYTDGHQSKDTVSALYQPKEGERC